MMKKISSLTFFLLIESLFSQPCWSHEGAANFLTLTLGERGQIKAEWEIPMQLLEDLWPTEAGTIPSTTELDTEKRNLIQQTVEDDFSLMTNETICQLRVTSQGETLRKERLYEKLTYEGVCGDSTPMQTVTVIWKFLNEDTHDYSLLVSFHSAEGTQSGMTNNHEGQLKFGVLTSHMLNHFFMYIQGGILHIFGGIDHILFLLTLILPAVFYLNEKKWLAQKTFSPVFIDLLKTISAFTLAHSITLCLVTFGVISISARLIEPLIAFSVLVASINNLFPLVGDQRWKFAFLFGLIHGIGFAEVLIGMHLPTKALISSLIGYNLGVEAGQLVIVAATLPMFFLLRSTKFYKFGIFYAGSATTGIIAVLWMIDRIFDLQLMPF